MKMSTEPRRGRLAHFTKHFCIANILDSKTLFLSAYHVARKFHGGKMHRSYLRPSLIVSLMLLAIAACVLPGRAVQPAQVANPNGIETTVASTAQAAAQQTKQA